PPELGNHLDHPDREVIDRRTVHGDQVALVKLRPIAVGGRPARQRQRALHVGWREMLIERAGLTRSRKQHGYRGRSCNLQTSTSSDALYGTRTRQTASRIWTKPALILEALRLNTRRPADPPGRALTGPCPRAQGSGSQIPCSPA